MPLVSLPACLCQSQVHLSLLHVAAFELVHTKRFLDLGTPWTDLHAAESR